jgi:signal transduction histidine kinase/HAMP domain-containing protein
LHPLDPIERDSLARVVDQEYAELNINGTPSLTSQAEIPMPGIVRPNDSAWRLLIVQDVQESLEPIEAARMTRLGVGLLALLLGSGIGYLVSLMVTRSIIRLAKTVQEFGGGDYAKRMEINRSDEIGYLGGAFNEMADAIQTREIELQQWSSTLDRLVKDRTSELLRTNESLEQEITERQRIQYEVMLERIRLEALIESSHDGLILIGSDQRIQVINQMALRLLDLPGIPHDWLHYEIGDLREMEDGTVLEGLQRLRDVNQVTMDTNPVLQGEFPVGNYQVKWLNLPVEAEDVPFGRLVVLHDVTQQRMLERLRDDLIHTMVHDLRNPLGSIMVAMELFSDDPLSEEQRSMVNITKESLNRMANMVNAILDIGRLEAGSMPLERAPVVLQEISTQIIQMQQPLAQQKNLTLVQNIPDGLPLIDVDRDMISRVVQNLVGNAIKFTPANGTITIAAEPHDGEMLVTVKDTGPGIAPDVRDRLFQKFATGKQKGRGSGLGLAFSRLAVEAHGGRIWVESTSGEGTTFKFTLPFADGNKEAATNATRQGQGEQAPSP